MASRPHPDWTEPQKRVFRDINDARDEVIPYFGAEIPRLDNLTPEMLCDKLGIVKAAKKAIDKVEGILKERFKPLMKEPELRTSRFVATLRSAPRIALNQQKVKDELIERADALGVFLPELLEAVEAGTIQVPDDACLKDEESNEEYFNSNTDVETLNVKAI